MPCAIRSPTTERITSASLKAGRMATVLGADACMQAVSAPGSYRLRTVGAPLKAHRRDADSRRDVRLRHLRGIHREVRALRPPRAAPRRRARLADRGDVERDVPARGLQ